MMEGLEGLEYTNRGPTSQTAESTIHTQPESQPGGAVQTGEQTVQPPRNDLRTTTTSAPAVPDKRDGNLISELAATFGKQIEESERANQQPPGDPDGKPAVAEPPKEKTWRDAEPPPSTTKKVQEDWRQFKERAKADVESRDSRIKNLETELATAKTQLGTFGDAQKQLQQAQGVIERIAIEKSPLYKMKVLDQEDLLRARLGKVIDGTGITPDDAEAILTGNLTTRENVLEHRQMSAFRRQQIADILAKWDQVSEDRERLTTRGKETLAEFVREHQAAQEAQRAKFIRESEQTFNDQMTLVSQRVQVYRRIEGNEEWNKTVDQLKTTARRLYDGNVPPAVVAQAAILAPAAAALQNLLNSAYKQIDELKSQVEKLRGVQPSVRDSGGDVTQPGRALSSSNGDFVKDLVSRFQKETGLS